MQGSSFLFTVTHGLFLVLVLAAAAGELAADEAPARRPWSFEPLRRSTSLPDTRHADRARGRVDPFVFRRLEENGLEPNAVADRRTLIRRLSFVLCGLPPSEEAVERFVDDERPDAYERLVDRLLASPRFGERWGRHWLDVARYSESHGFEYDNLRPNAWHYRDYVIEAFNANKPYGRFIEEQIAGDVLEPATREGIIAASFLICGAWDQVGNGQQSDIMKARVREDELEDIISTVGQAFIGVTVHCARCHDHKFDPIPQRDYYRIKSVFESVFHGERELTTPREKERRAAERRRLEQRIGELAERKRALEEEVWERLRKGQPSSERGGSTPAILPEPFLHWRFDAPDPLRDRRRELGGELHGEARLRAGRLELDGKGAFFQSGPLPQALGEKTLAARVELATLNQSGGAAISVETGGGGVFDAIVFAERQERKWMAGSDGFRRTRDLRAPEETQTDDAVHLAIVYRRDGTIAVFRNGERYGEPYRVGKAPVRFEVGASHVLIGMRHTGGGRPFLAGRVLEAAVYDRALRPEEIRAVAADAGEYLSREEWLAAMREPERETWNRLRDELDTLRERLAAEPQKPVSYVGVRRKRPPTRLLERGDAAKPADVVAPGALSALGDQLDGLSLPPDAPEAERRRRFARWLSDPRNPLAARVIVNRIWHYVFGRGLVATPSDFGVNGARPTHPRLLDDLATRFVDSGGDIKRLVRELVTSETFRQSAAPNAAARAIDAENTLLWRYTPRRLEGEAIRDACLAVAGALDLRMGGPGFRNFELKRIFGTNTFVPRDLPPPEGNRRSVYRMNVNSAKDPLLATFDCPDPAVRAPRRQTTTTPLQALVTMNNAFVQRVAAAFARRLERRHGDDVEAAVNTAYRLAFARPPQPVELDEGAQLVREHGYETLCWALFNATEMKYVR